MRKGQFECYFSRKFTVKEFQKVKVEVADIVELDLGRKVTFTKISFTQYKIF